MNETPRRQYVVLIVLLVIYALLAASSVWLTPAEQTPSQTGGVASSPLQMPLWQLSVLSAGIVLVAYGLFSMAGYWFTHKLQIPWMYRQGAGWKALVLWPLLLGLAVGVILVIADRLFTSLPGGQAFPHPAFPLSLIGSAAAGIGEEILFRGLVMGLWAFLFSLLLRRWNGRQAALWIGNGIAALAFAASHLPAAMFLLNVFSPAQLPTPILLEILVLNGVLGFVAGERSMRDGLVTAMGVHFWADVVWHVMVPVLLPAA